MSDHNQILQDITQHMFETYAQLEDKIQFLKNEQMDVVELLGIMGHIITDPNWKSRIVVCTDGSAVIDGESTKINYNHTDHFYRECLLFMAKRQVHNQVKKDFGIE